VVEKALTYSNPAKAVGFRDSPILFPRSAFGVRLFKA
jgi:hypothetical protein